MTRQELVRHLNWLHLAHDDDRDELLTRLLEQIYPTPEVQNA